MRAGKGPAYERWAKIFNLKQMAATLQYLQENNLLEYEQLEQKASEVTGRFHTLYDSIKSTEAAMRVNAELKAAVVDYAKTRPVFEGIRLQGTARNTLRSIRPTLPPIGRRRTHSGVYCPGRSSPTWIRSKPKAGSLRQRKKPPMVSTRR